ncbi:MAG: Ig-like domain-containing protein, partial [Bradyrhizobium sp.]|uniref:Ig-like domain-containing protein n=1 Tax=Bradyrhizobium sp. TaxID=376 RepID=UPI002730C3A3
MARISVSGQNYSAIITEAEAYYYRGGKIVTLTKSTGFADEIDGGNATDYIEAGAGADTVTGGNGKDTLFGGVGDDRIWGDSQKQLDTTENGADLIYGGSGRDTIYGGNGTDVLYGDERDSGQGAQITSARNTADATLATFQDIIDGGNGGDRIVGGLGGDRLTGGLGPDVFVYDRIADSRSTNGEDDVNESPGTSASDWQAATGDEITDFTKGVDQLDFTTLNTGNTALHFSGTTVQANGIWYLQSGGATYLFADTDGDAKADMAIKVNGTVNFGPGDFIGLNDGPVAVDDIASTNEDTELLSINVLGNDSDVDGDTLSISGTPTALHGTVTVNPDNTLKYTPNANYNGSDTITYVVSDGNGGTDVGQVTITVNGVNDAPVSGGIASASGTEDDASIGGTVPAASDVDDVALTYGLVAGSVLVNG